MAGRRDARTPDLFEVPQPAAPLPAAMDYRAELSALVGAELREADGDRHEIAARMSRLAGHDVTKYMLDAYTSEGRETFNLPLWLVPSLEEACQTHAITNWLVGVRGGRLLLGRQVLEAEMGKWERQREQAARMVRELRKIMGEGEG
jgi:hypothetical protein